jgi:hypothetical protein
MIYWLKKNFMSKRTKGETCESILCDFFYKNQGWHKKVHLYAVAEDFSPETVGRTLRTLCEEGLLYVDYYDGRISKNLAMYSFIPKEPVKVQQYEIVLDKDGRPVAMPVY